MPSQSPMNGSTKWRTRASAITAGGNHHRHARQKEVVPVGELDCTSGNVSDVFVVRGVWINELSFDRSFRSLDHLYAITLRIVLNFVHDVVDEEHSAARGAEQILGIARIRNLTDVESLAFVFDRKSRFVWRQLGGDLHELSQIVFVAVLNCVNKRFVERDEKVRAFRTNQTVLRDAFL